MKLVRILSEIVEDCIKEKMPSHEECYWALQVYRRMLNMDHAELRKQLLADPRPAQWVREEQAKISFKMYKGALSKTPKEWLGKIE